MILNIRDKLSALDIYINLKFIGMNGGGQVMEELWPIF